MKKVLYIITKSNFGGAQRYVYDLATHLPERYEAVVALGGTGAQGAEPGALKERLDTAGVRTFVIPHFMRDMSLWDDVRAFFELWGVVWRERPDVLHVTSSKAGGLGALVGRLYSPFHRFRRTEGGFASLRIVFTSHGLTFDEAWRPGWQRALIYCFTWLTILLSTRTIQISRDTFERARRMPLVGRKVTLVHNGIALPDILPREEARHALLPHAPEAVHAFTWIGTIAEYHPNKNLGVLIEAVALMRHRGTPVQLVLIGEGEARDHLLSLARERKASDYVHCTGYVPDAVRYLSALDIFALPSLKEGLPYVLIEAGLAGLPVVVSDIPGNTGIITHLKTGLVVEPTATQLADAFTTLLENPDFAFEYATALHADVSSRFNIDRMVAETVATYA